MRILHQCKMIYYNFLQYQQNGSYLPIFCFMCKTPFFNRSYFILDINYGSITKQYKFWKMFGCSLGQLFLRQHDSSMNLLVEVFFILFIIIFKNIPEFQTILSTREGESTSQHKYICLGFLLVQVTSKYLYIHGYVLTWYDKTQL